jgi:AraC-like DNA-binding protein
MISRPRLASAQLVALIALCTLCNAVLSRDDYSYWIEPAYRLSVGELRPVMNLARNLTPALFMLVCHALFAPRQRFPLWLAALVALQMLLEDPIHGFIPSTLAWQPTATHTTATLLQTLFGAAALYWTLTGWRADLVEARRRIRAFSLGVIGLSVIATGLATRLIDPNSVWNFWAHEAATAVNLAIMVFVLLRLTSGDIGLELEPAKAPAPPPPAPGPEAAQAMDRLIRLMDGEALYREPGLTLKAIADKVGLPEYRLRRIIHGELGFSNFNAFLHSYRIGEACRRLADPAQARTPILTIALETGYQSVNTFNRGFRDVMGVTPSAYRAEPARYPRPP